MKERSNKTVMCSVLFLDIVEYSKMSVSGQISLKDRFNSYLSAAIRDMPVADRIILDTGDGAAINFLGDVEDALKTAISLRESILNKDSGLNPPLMVRAGINLGPVRLVRDINGQPNIVGDGINVAQRIMAFADVGQILVSRSYYDAVSRLSSRYAELFNYQGSRTDKHVREHEVYAIGDLGEETAELIATGVLAAQKPAVSKYFPVFARGSWNAVISWSNNVIKNLRVHFGEAGRRQRAIYAGVIVVSVVLIGVLALTPGKRDEKPVSSNVELLSTANDAELASTAAPAAPAAPGAESEKTETSRVQPAIDSKPDTKKITKVAPAPKKPADSTVGSKKTSDQMQSNQTKKADTQRKSTITELIDKKSWVGIVGGGAEHQGAPAHIAVRCHPGAQVFVSGIPKGKIISGVLVIDVVPGEHTVIVTSTSGDVYSKKVELAEGKTVDISPDFCK